MEIRAVSVGIGEEIDLYRKERRKGRIEFFHSEKCFFASFRPSYFWFADFFFFLLGSRLLCWFVFSFPCLLFVRLS